MNENWAARPHTNWPARASDLFKLASYYRCIRDQAAARTRGVASRAGRLAEMFEELGHRTLDDRASEPHSECIHVTEPKHEMTGRTVISARANWPAWATIAMAAFLIAGALIHIRNVSPPLAATFTGVLTDTVCGRSHTTSSDSACIRACIGHGAKYALFDGSNLYPLISPQSMGGFAGQRVRVSGTLDKPAGLLRVISIRPVS